MLSRVLQQVRFDAPLEAAFRQHFEALGKKSRAELWLVLLVSMSFALVFHRTVLQLPPEVLPLGRALLMGVLVPVGLRWLSGGWSPLHRWSPELYIAAALIDLICLLMLRVASLQAGYDAVPLILPVAVLLSLIVVQLRFLLLAPVVLAGLALLVGVEIHFIELDSNRLFQLAAAVALVLVALSPAYEVERWVRISWLRQRRLDELACTDALTGISNRRHFDSSLQQAIRVAARARTGVALMVLDVDNFKSYNDHYGHPAGDDCLRAVGACLREAMRRPGDIAARLGGEEFVLVWVNLQPDDAQRLAEALRAKLSTLGIAAAPSVGGPLSASAGLVWIAPPQPEVRAAELAQQMLEHADAALYEAKRGGRNRLVVSNAVISSALAELPQPTESTAHALGHQSLPVRVGGLAARWQALRFAEPLESAFRERFEQQGRSSRMLILCGLLAVIAFIMASQKSVLKIPDEADFIGRLTLMVGLVPATLLALLGCLWRRWHRASAALYIGAVAVILAAQMAQRVVQLPKGFDVVPLLMPISVLLSLTVVQLRWPVLSPAILIGLAGVLGVELWAFEATGYRLLEAGAAVVMVLVTLSFSYKLELWTRKGWQRERLLDQQACTDALTGLFNRRHFDDTLRQLLRQAQREQKPLALALLDVDHFKAYNDHYGHPAGDECLMQLGKKLGGH